MEPSTCKLQQQALAPPSETKHTVKKVKQSIRFSREIKFNFCLQTCKPNFDCLVKTSLPQHKYDRHQANCVQTVSGKTWLHPGGSLKSLRCPHAKCGTHLSCTSWWSPWPPGRRQTQEVSWRVQRWDGWTLARPWEESVREEQKEMELRRREDSESHNPGCRPERERTLYAFFHFWSKMSSACARLARWSPSPASTICRRQTTWCSVGGAIFGFTNAPTSGHTVFTEVGEHRWACFFCFFVAI